MTPDRTKQAFVALVTCFRDDETVDHAATRAQVRRQVAAGNNVMCAGTNGDFTALTFAEKVALCAEVVDEVAGRARVIVNAGMPATFETILLAKEFENLGVDGIAVITPFFIQCTQDGLVRHFSAVADAVTTPVYLYDIPARTQNHIEPDTARTLAAHGNIAGIKDSGGARETLEQYLAVSREMPGFDVYSGPDHLVHWAFQNGAKGCISGLGNVMPETLAAIVAGFNAGDTPAAEAAQAAFGAFRKDLYGLGYPPALVKRALYLMDNSVGASRQPALLPDPEQDAKIAALLVEHGLMAGPGVTLVLSTAPAFGRHGRAPARLAALGWTVVHADTPTDYEALFPEADFLVVGLLPVTAAHLAAAPRLRGVLKHGVGTDNIDIAACTARGVPVLNAPGANAAAVAELAIGLLVSLARAIPRTHAETVAGGWNRIVGREIGGSTLGIVGLGTIGQQVARRALALGMTVVATDPVTYPAFLAAHPVEMLPLPALLARADHVSLHLSGTARVLGASEFAAMKPGAALLNLARGDVIDIDALDAALGSGTPSAAALDAYVVEPPDRTHPIFARPNAIFTPHSGGNTVEAVERIALMAIDDIETLRAGGRPTRTLNPAAFGAVAR